MIRWKRIRLRPAKAEDCRQIWIWRNEPGARAASFNTQPIAYEAHEAWFRRQLEQPEPGVFIGLDAEGAGVGYVRADGCGPEVRLSLSVDAGRRGRGFGAALIREALACVPACARGARVLAHVKPDNPASRAAFERAGFVALGRRVIDGHDALELAYEPGAGVTNRQSRCSGTSPVSWVVSRRSSRTTSPNGDTGHVTDRR